MTFSIHKYRDFFPGTGNIEDIGVEKGKYYSLNAPMQEGLDDDYLRLLYKPIIEEII